MVVENVPYAVTLNWVRCRLNFALPGASIMSISGEQDHPVISQPPSIQLTCSWQVTSAVSSRGGQSINSQFISFLYFTF